MTDPVPLPVDSVLTELRSAVDEHAIVVLEAPPGAGKTTRVPPALCDRDAEGRVLVLEPRRVAARAAAQRMATERGEQVGESIGLRTRFDTRVGPDTRIEVVTEGVLTRMLLADPSLDGVDVVVFDEFHERSIHADTALAMARESLDALRDDLRLVVMSATLDTGVLAGRLDAGAVITASGRSHPVSTTYRPPAPGRTAEDEVPDAVVDALRDTEGDILVFLAGAADINRAARALGGRLGGDVVVTPLHGSLPPDAQDRALQPDPSGRRKVVLATPIAETSVTIDGVRTVIDTGRRRRPEIDHGRGMSRLRTVSASRASTDQRRGRAGRQTPGTCIRLWPEADQARRRAEDTPEIMTADLTGLALQLAAWGATDASELPWLDAPPEVALSAGRGVLTGLGAIDDSRRLTSHGRRMADIGAEPRLAHLLLEGAERGDGATACDLAALLADRDLLRGRDRPTDLAERLDALAGRSEASIDPAARGRARESSRRWRRELGIAADASADPDRLGPLVSLAFPERIAQRRRDPGSFLLASGAGATVPLEDPLAHEDLLAVAETEGAGADARIRTAAPLDVADLEALHGRRIEEIVHGGWDRRARDVVFERQRRLGALILSREPVDRPDRAAVVEALVEGVRREGVGLLTWSSAAERLRERMAFLHEHDPERWPAVGDDDLLDTLDDWLVPRLGGAGRRRDLERVDVREALAGLLDWRQSRDLDRLAPTHLTVPSGSRIPIGYAGEAGPVLAVRLQEMFGLAETPTVAGGEVPIVVHLLSPAHRPVQVTSDLASFWADGYAEVRRELRGRYPKHEWPEDPTAAAPTKRAKRRS